jgi:nitrate/nitrite transporter NarK
MNRPLVLAVIAMLVQQAFAYMSGLVVPVAAPAIARDVGVDPALVGFFTSCMFVASMISQVSCGGFIIRYGALRMSQVSLLFMTGALLLITAGTLPAFVAAALILGTGTAPSTPASSQILARYSPPRLAPLIFSVKQTGVPVGAMIAGLLVPPCIVAFGWRGAFVVTALLCLALAVILQPLRAEFDQDRKPDYPVTPRGVLDTLRTVLGRHDLRVLAIAAFAFVGLQSIFATFFVTYLTVDLGHSLAEAATAFAIAQAVAIPARILWGWVGISLVAPRIVLGWLGIAMAAASIVTGLFEPDWSLAAVTIVGMAYTATAISWHGVLLAEVARLAPEGRVAAMTGGVLSFGSAGMMSYPLVLGILRMTTGTYAYGFWLLALPALVAGILLFRQRGG